MQGRPGDPGEATQSEASPRKESTTSEDTQPEAAPRQESTKSEATQSEEATPHDECSKTHKEDCSWSQCCKDAGMQCYRKNEYWSACKQARALLHYLAVLPSCVWSGGAG